MRLEDALFNWLQMRIVCDARPDDGAAFKTLDFFAQILAEDHGITGMAIVRQDETVIDVRLEKDGETIMKRMDRESAEQLLHDINANPKYN
ncbi:hypothetical protein ABEV74_16695 [Paenibacillus cisolokensis]|jgi:hypothetical protein|uniref:Uncharacterized protein n=1 Tax=Paenibacillus cisolokensis TaxID=1658519 RepID=A0ABQ4N2Z4_9BACL|nr:MULTISPECIES: hypothetical protein [Paenibacillus]ALS27329.1 hypothetical protein IJ21_19280 [Paenibacillus sp. 32O-W]GIQ62341.1 hypothetical protein PACILC2_09090 [Paenibacillus cisolokensis]